MIFKSSLDENFVWSQNSTPLDVGITGAVNIKGTCEIKGGLKIGKGLDSENTTDSYVWIKEYNAVDTIYNYPEFDGTKDLANTYWFVHGFSAPEEDFELYINFQSRYSYYTYRYKKISVDSIKVVGTRENNTEDILWAYLTNRSYDLGVDSSTTTSSYNGKVYFDQDITYNVNFTVYLGDEQQSFTKLQLTTTGTTKYVKAINTENDPTTSVTLFTGYGWNGS